MGKPGTKARAALALLGLAVLAACASGDEYRPSFDGHYFRAKLAAERDVRQNFLVTVQPVSASQTGAREAARFEAVKYCIKRYGTSDILWSQGPDAASLATSADTATFRGACAGE